mmetsp:Transcript_8935/g.25045  ORF Transcript_8935/g.25045 Transcript_8935/m.25045 type:complete len:252 (+) Transcript_8935:108-863(+)|eukprot:CAMPEP_0119145600 /NCGR_PEP_ID=MMETSP1310-20130426/37765_1 /TAXON_ID=464262 /ORGANISM="Genus nov. species nov., Strain RCC2339" /LENGTH=251 /DNA_ID=CAMNT_0007137429 /DNA_START=97 /DNA_END=852 /DNA_ORIENTATION=-
MSRSSSVPSARVVVTSGLVAISSVIIVMLLIPGSVAQRALLHSFHWMAHQDKAVGSLFLIMSYATSIVFMVPGTPFNLSAGYLFGAWMGAPVAHAGAVLGGVIAFYMARTLFREWAEGLALQYPKFHAIDKGIEKNGLHLVFLMRLSPLLPFPVICYVFGISKVSFRDYFLGTLFGLIPVSIMEAMIGAEMKGLAAAFGGSSHTQGSTVWWIILVVASTGLIFVVITYYTQEAIRTAMESSSDGRLKRDTT